MKPLLKYYLAAYNLAAFFLWGSFLFCFVSSSFQLNCTNLLLLQLAQGVAVFEILHVILKWVKSPLASTVVQVLARFILVAMVTIFVSKYSHISVFKIGVIIISLAWSITELVRYSLYSSSFISSSAPPAPLVWMRYSFFIFLYPLGVLGEALILATPLVAKGFSDMVYVLFAALLSISYIYYFPILYRYMWKQRSLKLT